jgi:putative salt-induced outer membrane protein YdiY
LFSSKIALPVLLIVISPFLLADQIVLKNGDRLTGTIQKSDDKSLVLKTDYAGEVTVKWEAVQDFKSDQPLHVGLKNGETVVGPVTASSGKVEVSTKTAGNVETATENVVLMRSDAEQAAWEKSQHPGLLEGWNGGVNVGFALTGGNSQTKNLALALNGVRTGLHDKITLYEGSVYSTNDLPGADPHVTANSNKGGIRYDRDIKPRLFGFVNADFSTDALQDLNLRSVFGGGLGWHAIKRETTTLDVLGGVNYTYENYTQIAPVPEPPNFQHRLIHRFAAGTIGDEFMHKISNSTVITQKAYFFDDIQNTGDYRATFDFGTVTKISKWLGWQNAFGDVYVTNPPAGKKGNDLVFTTGLNISFTH